MKEPEFRLLHKASEEGLLKIDVVGYDEIKESSNLIDEKPFLTVIFLFYIIFKFLACDNWKLVDKKNAI